MTIIESLIVVIQNILQFGFYFIIRPIKKAIRLLGLIQNNFFKYMNIQNARKENHKTPSFPSFYRQNCQNLRHKLFELYMYELGLGGIYYLRFSLSIVLLTGSIDALYG